MGSRVRLLRRSPAGEVVGQSSPPCIFSLWFAQNISQNQRLWPLLEPTGEPATRKTLTFGMARQSDGAGQAPGMPGGAKSKKWHHSEGSRQHDTYRGAPAGAGRVHGSMNVSAGPTTTFTAARCRCRQRPTSNRLAAAGVAQAAAVSCLSQAASASLRARPGQGGQHSGQEQQCKRWRSHYRGLDERKRRRYTVD